MAKRLDQTGFTLLEVLMAMTIFSFFIMAFMLSQGFNITSSTRMAEDVRMHNLCERMINESILNPPKFTNATENDVVSKNFSEEGIKHYKYTIKYKKMEVPDFATLIGKTEEQATEEVSSNEDALKKLVYDKLKKNVEQIIWQLQVTITNTETDYKYSLSSWVINPEAKMDTNFAF